MVTVDNKTRMIGSQPGIRRLTPRECERLQGFPDDWTRWDVANKEMSNTFRYKAMGNAVAVNVAEWIGRQLRFDGAHE